MLTRWPAFEFINIYALMYGSIILLLVYQY
jgi:hypothetical protein